MVWLVKKKSMKPTYIGSGFVSFGGKEYKDKKLKRI